MSSVQKSPDFIQSLARGLDILELFGEAGGEVSVAEAAEHAGLNRATARRLLLTLVEVGYLRRTGRTFQLSPKVLQLGYRYLAGLGISDLLSEQLDALATTLGEAVSLTVRDGPEIVYVARARLEKVMTVALSVGARLPVWTTSMGRVLLSAQSNDDVRALFAASGPPHAATTFTKTSADEILIELETVRNEGYCLVDQELEWGLRSIAVPVMRSGRIFAALNVATANASEALAETRNRLLPALQVTATEIAKILQAAPLHTLPKKPHT
jgi:IclR family pca regulon transcriptional regulator